MKFISDYKHKFIGKKTLPLHDCVRKIKVALVLPEK